MVDQAPPLPREIRDGSVLYGNDLTGDDLSRWYEAEAKGYFGLYADEVAQNEGTGADASNRLDTRGLHEHYPVALVLGCADGKDILSTGLNLGKIIAVEPTCEWWSDRIGTIPSEYRMPELDGRLDLPDASVDIAIMFGVLHHVANVERVLAEVGRVMRPGASVIIREPVFAMGDFRLDRPGLTKCERGIPPKLMVEFLKRAGFRNITVGYSSTPGLVELTRKLGVYERFSRSIVKLDRVISNAMAWNSRYWRPRLVDKIAPRSASYRARCG
jgi:SAM-dependent methyltransferase